MRIYLNGKEYKCREGQTILEVARENSVEVPTLCHADELRPSGACGLCVVEADSSTRLLRACATIIADGMKVLTNSPKVISARKSILELNLSTHTGDCKAPCQLACPAQTDCQGYISLIAEGRLDDAAELMKDAHPFPASVARICPRPCESECRRKLLDEPVNIAGLKRFAADWALKESSYVPEIAPKTGKSIAIVGGGPAGLTAAYFLRRYGHQAEVVEAMPKMGGLLRYGIPEYRLPKAVLDAELETLERMDIQFNNNTKLGQDVDLAQLQAQHDAVVIAIGAAASKPLWCPGDDMAIGGTDFLRAVACGNPPSLGKRVVVVGGSNTAMDAARTALRLGAEVLVIYRRTKEEMPAEPAEIEEAIAEGVEFLFLAAPLEVTEKDGKVNGIKLQKMTLGEPDASGRRRPVPLDGEGEWLEADMIIAAIGQDVSLDGVDAELSKDNGFATSVSGVFAIGDVTGKTYYAIEAIGHGRDVADVVHEYLQGDSKNAPPWEVMPKILVRDTKTSEDFADETKSPRQNATACILTHTSSFDEIHQPFTPAEAAKEAERCLSCGCADYHDCKLVKLANQYDASPNQFSGDSHHKPNHLIDKNTFHFIRDMNKCVLCGLCARVCENNEQLLSTAFRGFNTTISTAFGQSEQHNEKCKQCGKCVSLCPVGALFIKPHQQKPQPSNYK